MTISSIFTRRAAFFLARVMTLAAAAALAGCGGGGGGSDASAAASTPVVAPVPDVHVALSATQVAVNQTSTLTWSSNNASSCTASGAWAGSKALTGTLMVTNAAVGTYTYNISCTGTGGTTTASAVLVVVTLADNVLAVTVDLGPSSDSFNMPFVSLTVCQPGTTICQTVDHVQLDTGSYGLRLLASAVNSTTLALPPVLNATSTPVAECAQFVSGYAWGSVRRADVKLSGETAPNLPIQIIADKTNPYASVPTACSDSGADLGTMLNLGANGVLGVGLKNEDCAPCTTSIAPALYYACSTAGCIDTTLPATSQVANPVPAFAVDNNGVMVVLPSVPAGGVNSLSGMLVFGIGTQSNNQLGSATVYAADNFSHFTTTYKNTTYSHSFIDSGSNGLFFTDSSITQCSSAASGFYCPSSTLALSAINTGSGAGAASGSVNFTVENIQLLSNSTAAANVGGTLGLSQSFDWGLPFFFGRTVFVAIKGASTPGGTGPYWAY